jgi:hypothetical protein
VPNKLYKNKNKKNEFLNNGTTSHHARLFGGLSGVGQLAEFEFPPFVIPPFILHLERDRHN